MKKAQRTNGEWTEVLLSHLTDEFGSKDLSRAIIAADAVAGIKRTEAGFNGKKTHIIGTLKVSKGVVFSKDNSITWSCLIMDKEQLERDLEPRVPGRKKSGCSAVVRIAPDPVSKPTKYPIASEEEGAFLIAFKIYRSAVRRDWKKGISYIPFEEIRILSMMEDADDFPNKEEITKAIEIVKSCGVELVEDPDFSGVTTKIPQPAIGLFHICIKGEELFPHRKRFKDFKAACDASYDIAKEAVLSYEKAKEAKDKTEPKENKEVLPETVTVTKEEDTPEFIELFARHEGDRQIICRITSMSEEVVANEIQKSDVKKLSSDGIYCITVGNSWKAELEMIKFLITLVGDEDEIFQNQFSANLYQKAQALEAYAMAKISEEFEKRGL